MHELWLIKDDLYQVHSSIGQMGMEGSFLAIATYMTFNLRINPNEIELAVINMIKNNTDTAKFNREKMFVYSYNRIKQYNKAG